MYVFDWFFIILYLVKVLVEGIFLDGVNQWVSISENLMLLRNEILYNIDFVDIFWGNLDGYFYCCSVVFRRGDWKFLFGCLGNGDWVVVLEFGFKIQFFFN